MANIFDVAHYILTKMGGMTAMKLQKLVYYSQCWSLVWDERPLFENEIQAWANGPVSPDLYSGHRGEFVLSADKFANRADCAKLDEKAIETIDSVIRYYGDKDAAWLSALTHQERPWLGARKGVPDGERSSEVITQAAMAEYYGGL